MRQQKRGWERSLHAWSPFVFDQPSLPLFMEYFLHSLYTFFMVLSKKFMIMRDVMHLFLLTWQLFFVLSSIRRIDKQCSVIGSRRQNSHHHYQFVYIQYLLFLVCCKQETDFDYWCTTSRFPLFFQLSLLKMQLSSLMIRERGVCVVIIKRRRNQKLRAWSESREEKRAKL